MKTIRRIVCGLLIAAPLFLAPAQSRAGGFGDFFHSLFGSDRHKHDHDHDWDKGKDNSPQTGNAVPINGGLIILLIAGLGLGARMMYAKNQQFAVDSIM